MTEPTTTGSLDRPRFSIVSAVYNVEPYLAEFIASLEAQGIPAGALEVIAVDDGSTDRSLEVLRSWAARSRHRVQVFTKPNGGQGSARNLGLEHATGEWVTFTDPDDMLDPGYFQAAERFADAQADAVVLSARPIIHDDATGATLDKHPRKWQYATSRVADLDTEDSVFLGVTPGSLFRLDAVREHDLTFDTRIRPNFEDAQFAVRYLLAVDRRRVGLLRDAKYIYRKRADGSSTLQGSMLHPGRFAAVFEHGYLDVLERARRPDGSIAPWVQQLVAYELSWYLSADAQITSPISIPPDGEARFHELWSTTVRLLDPAVVSRFHSRRLSPLAADLLAHGYRDAVWHGPATIDKVDRTMGLSRIRYRFTGPAPAERFEVDGVSVTPAWAKTLTHRTFGVPAMDERLLWLPTSPGLRAWVDDRPAAIGKAPGKPRRRGVRASLLLRLRPVRVLRAVYRRGRRVLYRDIAALPWYRRAFGGAWVLMDRVSNADDNAERLFEHLRAQRPDINAHFVIARDATDWPRLRRAYGERVVAWGSLRWTALMLNCAWLVSSHGDRGIVAPPVLVPKESRRPWRFAFLQHGVIKDDLSLWLNHRDIDMFVVSTAAELESVAGDGTAYLVTHKETRLTGLPRFDRLRSLALEVPEAERRLVIVAPTWRQHLTRALDPFTQRRAVGDDYLHSEYHAAWMGILRSPAIAEAVHRRGWRLAFMPHPNMQPVLEQVGLPPHVEALSFDGVDVQRLYAQCALLVTDYSSVAFNLAYLDRPIVYFQFDRDEMERGAHVGRKGYFDYALDGYGPVTDTLPEAEAAIVAAIERGTTTPAYQARIDAAFPDRDGGACARVVAVVEELSRPWAGLT